MSRKFELEYTFNTSPKVLYDRISTPDGLSEWFADDVNLKGDQYTFLWDGSEQIADIQCLKDNKLARYKWAEDDDEESYFEFRIQKDELTGDLALLITDFADEDEKGDAIDLWDSQVSELKHAIGL